MRADCARMPEGPHPWYALRVRSNFEKVTAAYLEGRGYAPFLPLYRSRRAWSDRLKTVDLPLFPGYMFCRFDEQKRLPIVSTPGVVMILGAGKRPLPVDEEQVQALQLISSSGSPAEPWPYLRTGQRVRITHGALAGVEGLLVELRKVHRLVLSISLLQRSVAVEIDRDMVAPVHAARMSLMSGGR